MQYIFTVVVARICACIFTSVYRLFYPFTHFWRTPKSHNEWLNVYYVSPYVMQFAIFYNLSFCLFFSFFWFWLYCIFVSTYVLVSSSSETTNYSPFSVVIFYKTSCLFTISSGFSDMLFGWLLTKSTIYQFIFEMCEYLITRIIT